MNSFVVICLDSRMRSWLNDRKSIGVKIKKKIDNMGGGNKFSGKIQMPLDKANIDLQNVELQNVELQNIELRN